MSAALSYYSVFSLAPLVIIASTIAGIFLGKEAAEGKVQQYLAAFVGSQPARAIEELVQNASVSQSGSLPAILGFLTLLLGASGLLSQLQDALNVMWDVKARPGRAISTFLSHRLRSLLLVLVIGFLLVVSLGTSAALAALSDPARAAAPIGALVGAGALFFSLLMNAALFAALFKFLPDVRLPWRSVVAGATATSLLFEGGKIALAYYLGRKSTGSAYGAAGSIILLMLWVYYASAILLFGAEITQVWARMTNTRVRVEPHAEESAESPGEGRVQHP